MFLYKFITKKYINCITKLLLLSVLYIFVYKVVLLTGGTKNVYPHLMYLPIILTALYYEITGGVVGGLLGGILLGIVPINTKTSELQNINTVSIRILSFVIIGGFVGYIIYILKKQYTTLENLYRKDSVTNVPNRVALMEELAKVNKYGKKESKILIVVYIENIIEIFNMLGHSNNEIALKSIAKHFYQFIEKNNIKMFNSHSLKFEFLLNDLEINEVENWLEKLNRYLHEVPLYIEETQLSLRTIMGVSEIKPRKNAEKIIREAYEAVEFASNNNKDFYVYTPMLDKNLQTTYLASQMDNAVKNNELYIEYQPKLDLTNNSIEEVEALVRWLHPEKGIIPPNEFIPKLEKTDSIRILTTWVLKRVLTDIKDWESKGLNLKVSVNVTPRDLKDKNFADSLLSLIYDKKVECSKINLEITETDFIKEIDEVIETIIYLREKGIKISIDDFGTGYSSLSYINTLPIDYIKIDRSFVKDLLNNTKNNHLLKDTVQLLHNLDKIVVAEGVEDEETLNHLKKLGCEEIQGYYISKPLPKDKLEIFLIFHAGK